MGPIRRFVREFGLALITLGVIILLFVAYELLGTNIAEQHSQSTLRTQFNAAIAHAQVEASTPDATSSSSAIDLPAPPSGGAIDDMRIPRISSHEMYVVQGTDENDLRQGPGHYPGTVMPGEIGNAAIAGHRTTYGAPFFDLNKLAVGDPIYITDLANRTFRYVVSQAPQVVAPDDVAVLDPTTFGQLTLTTCNPRFSATSRLVVFARLVGRALPAPTVNADAPAQPTTIAGVDNLGSGESGAWPAAIGYGALMLLMWIGVRIWINRTRRWHRAGAFIFGIGICLVPLWFLFENAVLLLPASI